VSHLTLLYIPLRASGCRQWLLRVACHSHRSISSLGSWATLQGVNPEQTGAYLQVYVPNSRQASHEDMCLRF
jgi:hypothetical protein